MNTSAKAKNGLINIFILMIILQGSLFIMKTILRNLFELTLFSENIMSAILFSIWHIGYVITPLLQGNLFALFSKMAVGLVYGLILGVVRMKTHNCYSTMLLHGVLNVFSM